MGAHSFAARGARCAFIGRFGAESFGSMRVSAATVPLPFPTCEGNRQSTSTALQLSVNATACNCHEPTYGLACASVLCAGCVVNLPNESYGCPDPFLCSR